MSEGHLFQLEMLRKGIISNIIWVVVIGALVGGVFVGSQHLWSDSHESRFLNKNARSFQVPLYECPVEMEVLVRTLEGNEPVNATIYLIDEYSAVSYSETEYPVQSIKYENHTDYFIFRGDLPKGDYRICVEIESGSSAATEFVVHYKNMQIFIIKPLMPYIFAGGSMLCLLLVIMTIRIVFRYRNVQKELVNSHTPAQPSTARRSFSSPGRHRVPVSYYSDEERRHDNRDRMRRRLYRPRRYIPEHRRSHQHDELPYGPRRRYSGYLHGHMGGSMDDELEEFSGPEMAWDHPPRPRRTSSREVVSSGKRRAGSSKGADWEDDDGGLDYVDDDGLDYDDDDGLDYDDDDGLDYDDDDDWGVDDTDEFY